MFIYIKGGFTMSKFRKNKSKIAVALLSTLFCNVNGASAMNSRMNINKTGVKSSQTLGEVRGAASGNININNSSNNKIIEWVKGHKWQTAVGGAFSVATVATLAFLGVKFSRKKDNGGGGGGSKPGHDQVPPGQQKDNNNEEQLKQITQENMNIIYSKIGDNNQSLKTSLDNFKKEIISESFTIQNIVDYRDKNSYVDYGGNGAIHELGVGQLQTAALTNDIEQNLSADIVKFFEDVFTGKKKLTQEQCEFMAADDDENVNFYDVISFSEGNEKYSIKVRLAGIRLVKYVNNKLQLEVNLKKPILVGNKVLSGDQTGNQNKSSNNSNKNLAFLFEDD